MLKNEDYFRRYGAYLSEGMKAERAWYLTERDFYTMYDMRRFRTFASFQDAHARYRSGERPRRIILHIVESIEIK